jgi:hypothetical protein
MTETIERYANEVVPLVNEVLDAARYTIAETTPR